MDNLRIEVRDGLEAKAWVDPFYESHGARARARVGDLFFLAMLDGTLVGCVRYCVEEETPLLRSMLIDRGLRRGGIGTRLLLEFESHLERNRIRDVHCVPYAHLRDFYGRAGFEVVEPEHAPRFLAERLAAYHQDGKSYLCMRRP